MKILQNYLTKRSVTANQQTIIISHDVIKYNFSKDRRNRTTVCSTEELKEFFKTFRDRIKAIIFFRREGTIDLRNKLIQRKFPIVEVKKKMLSHSKQKDLKILQELAQSHPAFELEAFILKSLRRKGNILAQVVK